MREQGREGSVYASPRDKAGMLEQVLALTANSKRLEGLILFIT